MLPLLLPSLHLSSDSRTTLVSPLKDLTFCISFHRILSHRISIPPNVICTVVRRVKVSCIIFPLIGFHCLAFHLVTVMNYISCFFDATSRCRPSPSPMFKLASTYRSASDIPRRRICVARPGLLDRHALADRTVPSPAVRSSYFRRYARKRCSNRSRGVQDPSLIVYTGPSRIQALLFRSNNRV